jgi:hypothetical protein
VSNSFLGLAVNDFIPAIPRFPAAGVRKWKGGNARLSRALEKGVQ